MKPTVHRVPGSNGEIDIIVDQSPIAIFSAALSPDAGADFVSPVSVGESATDAVQAWGDGNTLPNDVRVKAEANTTLFPLIFKKTAITWGLGLSYWVEDPATGEKDYGPIQVVDDFLALNDVNYLMLQRLQDYYLLNNLWCEVILNKACSEIVNISHMPSEFCRFGPENAGTKRIDEILFAPDWPSPKNKESVPYVYRRDYMKDSIQKIAKAKRKFAIHSCFPSPGRPLYASAPHIGLSRKNGWLDFANQVPEIMNAINDNAMDIKYHVRIPYEYWSRVNPDFNQLSAKKKQEFIDGKLVQLNDWLKGAKNAQKTFISHFATDDFGKPIAGWEIQVLDDKSKKDAYITSLQESDTQTARAVGMDTSLAGLQQAGGKMGAGSGSDKRVAQVNQVATSKADVYVVTDILRLVQMFNGWPANLKWGFKTDIATTLNEDKSGSNTINP